jgi:hypothetical protein
MSQGEFRVVQSKVEVRKGTKGAWIEVKVTAPDGTVTKFIMKKVDRFWSESEDVSIL